MNCFIPLSEQVMGIMCPVRCPNVNSEEDDEDASHDSFTQKTYQKGIRMLSLLCNFHMQTEWKENQLSDVAGKKTVNAFCGSVEFKC